MRRENTSILTGKISLDDNIEKQYLRPPSKLSQELWRKAYWRVKSNIIYNKLTESVNQLNETYINSMESLIPIKFNLPWCIIHPNSKIKVAWTGIVIFLLMYTAIITPFRSCFMDIILYSHWWWADETIDMLFFIDVLINLNSAYFDENKHLHSSRKKIFWQYLKSWMLLDICACIPSSIFTEESSSENNSGHNNLIKLIRLLRLYRLFKIVRLLKAMKRINYNDKSSKFKDPLNFSTTATKLFEFFVKTLICIHIVACFWYFSAKLQEFNYNTWIVSFGYEDMSIEDQYLRSFYWAFTTLTTVGYGDIHPVNNIEIVITICWMFFGLCFFSYTLGIISSLLLSQNTKEMVLNTKLLVIDQFIKEASLPRELSLKLREAIKYSNERNGFSWADKLHIFNELPAELRYEAALKMHSGVIERIPFFTSKDKNFISAVVPFLQNIIENSRNYLYQKDDHASEIYFVTDGSIALMYKDIPIKYCKPGKYFGEMETIEKTPRKFSAYVATSARLLVMGKELIYFIEEEFPDYYAQMKLESKLKRNHINTLQQKLKIFKRLRDSGKLHGKSTKNMKSIIDILLMINNSKKTEGFQRQNYAEVLKTILKLDKELIETDFELQEAYHRVNYLILKHERF